MFSNTFFDAIIAFTPNKVLLRRTCFLDRKKQTSLLSIYCASGGGFAGGGRAPCDILPKSPWRSLYETKTSSITKCSHFYLNHFLVQTLCMLKSISLSGSRFDSTKMYVITTCQDARWVHIRFHTIFTPHLCKKTSSSPYNPNVCQTCNSLQLYQLFFYGILVLCHYE